MFWAQPPTIFCVCVNGCICCAWPCACGISSGLGSDGDPCKKKRQGAIALGGRLCCQGRRPNYFISLGHCVAGIESFLQYVPLALDCCAPSRSKSRICCPCATKNSPHCMDADPRLKHRHSSEGHHWCHSTHGPCCYCYTILQGKYANMQKNIKTQAGTFAESSWGKASHQISNKRSEA